MQRDIQSLLKVLAVDTITVTTAGAPETLQGTEIDTKGARSVAFAVVPDEAIDTDDIDFTVYESSVSGSGFTEVDNDKLLPTTGTDRYKLTDAVSGALQMFGVTGTERYIKPALETITVADDLTVSVTPILILDEKPVTPPAVDALP